MSTIYNKDVYEKNLAVLRMGYPKEAEKVEQCRTKEKELEISQLVGWNADVLQVKKANGRTLVLSCLFGEEESTTQLLESWGSIAPRTPILIIGSGNIKKLRRIVEAAQEDCLILVYEPSIEIFCYVMSHFDITDLIGDCPILWKIGPMKETEIKDSFTKFFMVDTMSAYKQVISENYEELFPEEVKKILQLAKEQFQDMIVTWNTMRRYTDVFGHNMMYNIRHLFHGYNVKQLRGILRGEIPAVIISAGPSLNKNIEDLRLLQGKACLIAVDTAIKPLLNKDIIPDFFVIVDGKKPTELMAHPRISEVPLVTSTVVSTGIMDLHEGKKFFYNTEEVFEQALMDACEAESGVKGRCTLGYLPTGGSVANNAFSLADYMQASHIVFVGQDLALTNGRTHADGTFKDKMDKISEAERQKTISVEGIHGNQVYTRDDFYRYLVWFEDYIARHEMKNVIDATQGGAMIHGTKIMTLKAAAKKVAVENVNIQGMLEQLPEMLDWAAKCEFKKLYETLWERMHTVYVKAKQGESYYKKLEKEGQKTQPDAEVMRKLFDKITKNSDFMNNDREALFVQSCLQHLNFIMRMGIYEQEEDESEEIIQIAKHGKVLNCFIKKEAELWEEKMKKLVEERPLNLLQEDVQGPLDEYIRYLNERRE